MISSRITRAILNMAIRTHRKHVRMECKEADRRADKALIMVAQQEKVILAERGYHEELQLLHRQLEIAADAKWDAAEAELAMYPERPVSLGENIEN